MDNVEIFRQAVVALEKGQDVALVTVMSTHGSTPGKLGQKMLVFRDGRGILGTVGGGQAEARIINQAQEMLGTPGGRVARFDLGTWPDDDAEICGGSVEFLIETFDVMMARVLRQVVERTDRDDCGVLISIILPDGSSHKCHWTDEQQNTCLEDLPLPSAFRQEIVTAARTVAASDVVAERLSAGDMQALVESLSRPPLLILCGAGHLAWHIARCARSVHFRVMVCDDRSDYASRERFPDADDIAVEDFASLFDRIAINDRSYVVIVTRGHRSDEIVLERALQTRARYIGMIGSRRKTQIVLQKLAGRGISRTLLDRVYAPVGLAIGAVTVEEIALSIVCELVKVRRLGDDADIRHMALSRREGSA